MSATLSTRVVNAVCPHDCPDTCAMRVTVENGVATKVQGHPEHPTTAGALCTKVSRYTERTYHAERVLTPLRRVGPKGPQAQWQEATWEEALADISQKIKAIAARDPQAILPYSYAGTMGLLQGESMAARFFHRLGASLLDRTICASAGGEALVATLGGKLGMHVEQFAHSKLILIWGSNSIGSNLHFWRYVQEAKRQGAKLICIDPRRTETAQKCHQHIALRPGTDGALALSLMHELVVHQWLDQAYIDDHTIGWEGLRERALQWPPERAAEVCGISAEEIRQLACDYAQTKPAAIRLNYGMQRVRGGGNATRLISILPALVGAWRLPAGGMLMSASGWHPVNRAALERPDLIPAGAHPRTLNMSTIGDDLLRDSSPAFGPRIEAVVVYNSNPVAVAPQSGLVVQGFARADLFTVVLEHFLTDTADYADWVLPATTQLEHLDVHISYGHTSVLINHPAISPVGQAKPNTQIFRELAQAMGFKETCFQQTDEEMAREAFLPGTVTFDELQQRGWVQLPLAAAPFAQGHFPTPSGRCEIASSVLAARGLDPLPDFVANYESAQSNPELAQRFPLAMISPPARHFLNSTFVNVKSLRDIEREPILEIHDQDAHARGITTGALVEVFNDRGVYCCKAQVSDRARPGVVNGLGIWWRKWGLNGTNVNQLTHQQLTDLGRAPSFYDCLVQVQLARPRTAIETGFETELATGVATEVAAEAATVRSAAGIG